MNSGQKARSFLPTLIVYSDTNGLIALERMIHGKLLHILPKLFGRDFVMNVTGLTTAIHVDEHRDNIT